jgi:glyceraldehyde 3-phosphate dehydrogenase
MKIAINGFGRIGRAAAKIILDKPDIELVAINDLGDLPTLAHLLKYDSCYGIYPKEVGYDENELLVNTHKIHFYSEKDPGKLPWRELEIDVVIESTGVFLTKEMARGHIEAGAKKVILSAPAKDDTPIYVMGVNADKYADEKVISCASCTTNCITPIMKILEDNFGVEKSLMTTIHSYTADQNLVDGPHKDWRRARAAGINIVPTTTGAAKAAFKTIPALEGRFDGLAIRVPTPVVSLSDITAVLKKKTDAEELNKIFIEASEKEYEGLLAASDEPLVSTDLIQNSNSSIVDLSLTQVIKGDLVKVIAWYDNEWGYSNRLVELASLISN